MDLFADEAIQCPNGTNLSTLKSKSGSEEKKQCLGKNISRLKVTNTVLHKGMTVKMTKHSHTHKDWHYY